MSRKQGLGRGLGALIPAAPPTARAADGSPAPAVPAEREATASAPVETDLVSTPGTSYAEIPIDQVVPNPRQPRQVFDEEAMAELVHSITEIGLLQPVVVRPTAAGGFELVAGERRLRASREAGLTHIPAVVRSTDDDDLLRDALLENLHRSQLNALEEAAAYSQLMSDFGCTQDELARRIGRSRPQVTNTLRLLRLPAPVQRRVAAGVISAGHARALLSLDDPSAMEELANRIVAEGLSVRSVEEIVMVGDGRRQRKPRGRRLITPAEDVAEQAATLAEVLDTAVSIDMGSRRGRITITVADAADLARIVALIARSPAPPAHG